MKAVQTQSRKREHVSELESLAEGNKGVSSPKCNPQKIFPPQSTKSIFFEVNKFHL